MGPCRSSTLEHSCILLGPHSTCSCDAPASAARRSDPEFPFLQLLPRLTHPPRHLPAPQAPPEKTPCRLPAGTLYNEAMLGSQDSKQFYIGLRLRMPRKTADATTRKAGRKLQQGYEGEEEGDLINASTFRCVCVCVGDGWLVVVGCVRFICFIYLAGSLGAWCLCPSPWHVCPISVPSGHLLRQLSAACF